MRPAVVLLLAFVVLPLPLACPALAEQQLDSSLELDISTAKGDYLVAEPVLLRLDFHNDGETTERLLLTFSPAESYMVFWFRDEAGSTYSRRTGFSMSGIFTREKSGFELGPNECRHGLRTVWSGKEKTGGLVFPEPGQYEIWCEFQGWREKIVSNVAVILVHAPEGTDRAVFEHINAESLIRAIHTNEVVAKWEQIIAEWPTSTYAPYALFFLASYERWHGDPRKARDLYNRLLTEYEPFGYTEMAEFHLADCQRRLGATDLAESLLAELAEKYPGSDLADPVQIPYREQDR
jgi:hypothetical protein